MIIIAEGVLIFDYEIRKIVSCFALSLNEMVYVEVPWNCKVFYVSWTL